jgi:hypothetical protein
MDRSRRDTLDLALVVVAVLLVLSTLVDVSGITGTVGGLVGAVTSIDPIAYLLVFAAGGVLFLAYGLLYLPGRESG